MALTVQTDSSTVVTGADSYISQTDADTYFTERDSPSTWTDASSAAQDSALRYATRWIDDRYEWIGVISTSDLDRLDWPRDNAVDADLRTQTGVPARIRDAVCEIALAHLSTAVNATEDRGGRVVREKVDVIEIEYQDHAPGGVTYPFVDQMILSAGLGEPSMQMLRLVKA